MQTRTVEQVESWEDRPFSGGYAALHDLSDDDFTGAVVAGGTWLFMLNGRVVGVFDGEIDDFEDGTGSVYTAPHDSLPLLFSMQERGGSTRAKYFTNDTPIREADNTLTSANFTGYIELSENVLSGDYYLVYYGGKQMSAAFIGQSERLVTGSEAFDRAADEVGVYEVKDVSMNITEIPAPAKPDSDTAAVADVDDADETESQAESGPDVEDAAAAGVGAAVDEAEDEEPAYPSEPETPDESEPRPSETPEETGATADMGPDPGDVDADTDRAEPGRAERSEPPGAENDPDTAAGDGQSTRETQEVSRADDSFVESPPEDEEKDELERMFEEEEEWRQTRSIPALDPDESERPTENRERRPRQPRSQPGQESSSQQSQPSQEPSSQQARTAAQPSSGVTQERVDELREAIQKREAQIEELSASMEDVKRERTEMAAELEELREERDELEERVSNLESALQRAKDQQASVDTTATELSPEEALAGTNLFVRYDSKGKPTLDALSGGEVDPEAVNANLKLEHHTQFEVEDVVIEGREFDPFLEETSAYRFVSWVVRELPYELLDSGKRNALSDLYEAIPSIDRIEFEGEVSVAQPDGDPVTGEFGVVMRDRMGNPLIVADLNDKRDPVRGEEMSELVQSATTVGDVEESLSGAFYVTASFFEPAALEEAEAAASTGGLFSRSDKASYVKTATKSGFHLCLVEDRSESFHVTVPEL